MPMNSLKLNETSRLALDIVDIYSFKRKRPKIILDENYKVKEIYVSSSLLKKMFFRGETRDFCPSKLYHVDIVFDYREDPSISMQNGLYFETGILGATADGTPYRKLPRKQDGSKTIDNLRIDQQIINAITVIKSHGMLIIKDGPMKNTQLYKVISFPDYVKEGVKVFLEMTMDLVTPLDLGGVSYTGVIVDLKLTKSLKTEYGEYCWAKPHLMDHTQAFIYSFYMDLPFFYLVFDYPVSSMSYRFVPVNTNLNHPEREKANEARIRFQETHELIRKSIDMLISFAKHGWYTNPSYDNCKNCPIVTCEDRGRNQEI